MKVAVISCGSKKNNNIGKTKAKDLYIGLMFKWARRFVESNYPNWCILSAKYHVLLPDDEVDYYNQYLGDLSKKEKAEWSKIVFDELVTKFPKNTQFDFYTSAEYYKDLIPLLDKANIKYTTELEGLGLGYKLQWFKQHTKGNTSKKLF